MRFVVIEPAGEEVRDPETNEVLGSLKKPKVHVEVTQVGDKMAVARTYTFSTENVGGSADSLTGYGQVARMFAPPRYVRHYDTLKSEDVDWEPLDEKDSYVGIGDPVIEVVEQDKEDDIETSAVIAEQE